MQPARSYSPLAIHSRHLRGLAADQRATGRATALLNPRRSLIENARLQFFRADIIEKKERPRAEDGDVVDAMVDQIGADGVVLIQREGDLSVWSRRHQRSRPAPAPAFRKIRREQSAEPADLAQNLGAMRLATRD